MSLEKINLELKESNIKLDDLKLETVDTNEYLNLTNDTLSEKLTELTNFLKGSSLKELEQKREERVYQDKLLAALKDKKTEVPKEEKKKEDITGLGGLLTGLATIIGTVVGVIKGQLQAIKYFSELITKVTKGFAKLIEPTKFGKFITKQIDAFTKIISNTLNFLKTSITTSLSNAGKFFKSLIPNFVSSLSNALLSTVKNAGKTLRGSVASLFVGLSMQFDLLKKSIVDSKVIKGIQSAITMFFKPFVDLFDMIKKSVTITSKVGGIFTNITETFTKFATKLKSVAGFVGKLFFPLTIIMTIWDTVKGMLEGFEKDGIIGGIKGAITGFINSLILGPLDMIKNAIAWVLGAFGFDKAEEILKSFSFADTFTSIIENLFYPFQWLQDNVMEMVDMAKNFFSNKLKSIKAMFGFGGDEKEQKSSQIEQGKKGIGNTKATSTAGNKSSAKPFVIGEGDTSDSITGENGQEIVYKYSQHQPYTWTPEEIKEKVKILQNGDGTKVQFGTELIPKDNNHINPVIKNKQSKTAQLSGANNQMSVPGVSGTPGVNGQMSVPGVSGTPGVNGQMLAPILTIPSVTKNEQMTRQMAQSQEEQQILRDQASAGGGGSVLSQSSTVNNMTNNNTTVVKPSPSATRVPQAASDMFYNQMGYRYTS